MRRLIIAGENRLILREDGASLRLPQSDEISIPEGVETFVFDGYTAFHVESLPEIPAGFISHGLRESWGRLPAEEFAAASKGAELLNWNAAERYCARCGHPLERATEISKRCPECGAEWFPRLNPAIVVLVTRGEEALLVHAKTLKAGVHALVAGFVETGETLEECVAREIREETSLEVEDIRYAGSQAWPFPYQLMVGFTARWKSGEVRYADGELSSGRFFRRDEVPLLPTLPSLSRRIIDRWVAGELPENAGK